MLASGVTLEDNWSYGRGVRTLPVLWIRDSNGHWHTTRTSRLSPWNDTRMVMLWLAIVPPLEADAAWIDMVAAAPSATVRPRCRSAGSNLQPTGTTARTGARRNS